jgi:hypothetical protein
MVEATQLTVYQLITRPRLVHERLLAALKRRLSLLRRVRPDVLRRRRVVLPERRFAVLGRARKTLIKRPRARRFLGNFPQALSHIALVNSAFNLNEAAKPAKQRSESPIDNVQGATAS